MAYIVKVNIIIYNEQSSLEYNIKNIFSFSGITIFSFSYPFYKISYLLFYPKFVSYIHRIVLFPSRLF